MNGEPPLRVDGPNILITFTASYWRGVAPAGEDYGWRLVCFNTPSGGIASDDEAKDTVIEAQRAADRAEAVDAVNGLGCVCDYSTSPRVLFFFSRSCVVPALDSESHGVGLQK